MWGNKKLFMNKNCTNLSQTELDFVTSFSKN